MCPKSQKVTSHSRENLVCSIPGFRSEQGEKVCDFVQFPLRKAFTAFDNRICQTDCRRRF